MTTTRVFSSPRRLFVVALLGALPACSVLEKGTPVVEKPEPGIFGEGGILSIGGGSNRNTEAETLGVNRYLWRASLDVLSAAGLPLASSDPFGGAATTDWGSLEGDASTQFKITSYVDSPELRAASLRVVVNKRVQASGGWREAPVKPETARQIENAILNRARELRIAELER